MRQSQDAKSATFSGSFQQLELYKRIQNFEIDQPNIALPFSKRLARENQWSLLYTHRVIEEYKKFLFLAIVADHPVTPAVAIDEAWHLHLTYTHSYGDDLCSQVLQKPLHHQPTKGGVQQRQLFWDYYRKTLESYESFFSDRAPDDIWMTPAVRFGQAGQFRRVNAQNYWLIPELSKQLHQGFWRAFYFLKQSFVITALLTFSLALSGSSAIAQFSSQANHRFSSHLASQSLPPFKLEVIQKAVVMHPWLALWLCLASVSFLVGILLSFKPIFINPSGVIQDPNHNSDVFSALLLSSISASILITLYAAEKLNLFNALGVFVSIVWFILFFVTTLVESLLLSFFKSVPAKSRSWHPLHCEKCRQELNKLDASVFLTETENVADKISSVHWETWHCRNCHPEINRDSILLYRYVTKSERFKQCQNCGEITMTKTSSKILEKATTASEGRKLVVYTCQCCTLKEENMKSLPKLPEGGSDCCGCM
jgi:hypothetical protein